MTVHDDLARATVLVAGGMLRDDEHDDGGHEQGRAADGRHSVVLAPVAVVYALASARLST